MSRWEATVVKGLVINLRVQLLGHGVCPGVSAVGNLPCLAGYMHTLLFAKHFQNDQGLGRKKLVAHALAIRVHAMAIDGVFLRRGLRAQAPPLCQDPRPVASRHQPSCAFLQVRKIRNDLSDAGQSLLEDVLIILQEDLQQGYKMARRKRTLHAYGY